MASGSSGRNNNPAPKGFDFGSDDVLFSYEDYGNQESSNGSHSDPVIGTNSSKEFHKSRMTRSSMFPASSYSPPEGSFNQDVISTVETTMKKYADNLMRFLEGISSRLSQLELYCYNLDKSIGEMRSDLVRDHGEADSKLKSLEKHLQEVHRSVQILRDKQELAETQKELAKLQLAQKESSSANNSQPNHEERSTPTSSDSHITDGTMEIHGQQLALALPHQVAPPPPPPPPRVVEQHHPVVQPPPMPPQTASQPPAYYLPAQPQLPSPPFPTQQSQGQYPPSDSPYRPPQTQPQVNQTQQVQPLPQYQQQWPPQLQIQSSQQPSMPTQIRPPPASAYPPYLPSQQATPPPETLPNSMPMQVPYGYGGPGGVVQQQTPPQHPKPSFGTQSGDGYVASRPLPTLSPQNPYLMYENEGGRTHHPPQQQPHFQQQGGYQLPPPPTGGNLMARPSQFMRSHPYNELVEKLVGMGYRGDHVMSVIQRLEESGQAVDFNTVLDRLNGHSSGGSSQRGWSG